LVYTTIHYHSLPIVYILVSEQHGMSKQTQTSEDFFDVYKQNVEKYFENAVDAIPQYLQSWTNIQSEGYKACKNTISSAISLQQ